MRRQITTTLGLALVFSMLLNGAAPKSVVKVESAMAYAGFTAGLPELGNRKPFEKARDLIKVGRIREAEEVLAGLSRDVPEIGSHVNAALAELRMSASDTPTAVRLLREIAFKAPSAVSRRSAERLAEIEMRSRNFDTAATVYRNLAAAASGDAAAEYEIKEAAALSSAGKVELSLHRLRGIISRRVSPQVKVAAASIILTAGGFRGDDIEKAADIFYAGGDFATAATLYRDVYGGITRTTETQKRRASLLFQVGRSQERSDRFRAAIKTYKELLTNYPVHSDPIQVRYHIGLCYQRIGKDAIGEQYFSYILKKAPDSQYADDVLFRIASGLDGKDKRAEALAMYRRLLKEYPKSTWADVAAWNIGFSMFEAGMLREAESAFNTALKAFPNSDYAAAMGYWRGRILEEMNDTAAADQYRDVLRKSAHRYYRGRAAVAFRRVGGVVTDAMIDDALDRAAKGKLQEAIADLAAIWEGGAGEVKNRARGEMKALAGKLIHWDALSRFTTDALDESALTLEDADAPQLKLIARLIDAGLYEAAADELGELKMDKGWRPETRLAKARVLAEGGEFRLAIREVERLADELGTIRTPAAMPDVMAGLLYPRFYSQYVEEEAEKYDMDPRFVLAVIREESRFDQGIASWAGAQGLMQIMPATGANIARNLNFDGFRREDLRNPAINIAMGVFYLSRMKRLYDGREYLALAGYNAGPGNASRWMRQSPELEEEIWIEKIAFRETRNYVKKVLGSYWTYKLLDGDAI